MRATIVVIMVCGLSRLSAADLGGLIVNVKADGTVVVNRRTLSNVELSGLLKGLVQLDSQQKVVIRGDETCAYKNIVGIQNICTEAGITNVAFALAKADGTGSEVATSTIIQRPNTFTSKVPGDTAGSNKKRALGFSDLDQLLAQKGPLGPGTKIRMLDDQLFTLDSADLPPSSILQKLVTLLKRNPKATLTIEGYTDSIGTDEYKLDLSQRRAESVKRYLVETLSIDPNRIQARGYGKTKFIVAPHGLASNRGQAEFDAEIERERPNRRIEVTIDTNLQ